MGKQQGKKASIYIEDENLTIPGVFVERLINLFEDGMEREEIRKDEQFTMEKNKVDWMNERREFIKCECAKIEDRMKKLDVLSEEYSELAKVYNKLINIDKSYMW